MNRNDIANLISQHTNIDISQADAAIIAFINIIKGHVKNGESVTIHGFGVFKGQHFSARTARNVVEDKEIIIKPCSRPVFKPSKDWRKW